MLVNADEPIPILFYTVLCSNDGTKNWVDLEN